MVVVAARTLSLSPSRAQPGPPSPIACPAHARLRVRVAAPMQEVCAATLRLVVHRINELRSRAIELGVAPESVKPINQGNSGMMSFRKFGFGTTRGRKKQNE